MRVRINLDWDVPRWVKYAVFSCVGLACLLGVGFGVLARATPVTVQTFSPNELLSSSKLNAQLTALQDAVNQSVPPGTIVAYAGPIDGNPGGTTPDGGAPAHLPPSGWLLCNGDALNGLDKRYLALYMAIGTSFGGVTTSQSFNLPDLRGRFLRGVSGTSNRDPDATARTAINPGGNSGNLVGSVQTDNLGTHKHGITDPGHTHQYTGVGDGCNGSYNIPHISPGSCVYSYATAASSTGITETNMAGGTETRPLNVYVNYIIKY